jgi:hypothetical protein
MLKKLSLLLTLILSLCAYGSRDKSGGLIKDIRKTNEMRRMISKNLNEISNFFLREKYLETAQLTETIESYLGRELPPSLQKGELTTYRDLMQNGLKKFKNKTGHKYDSILNKEQDLITRVFKLIGIVARKLVYQIVFEKLYVKNGETLTQVTAANMNDEYGILVQYSYSQLHEVFSQGPEEVARDLTLLNLHELASILFLEKTTDDASSPVNGYWFSSLFADIVTTINDQVDTMSIAEFNSVYNLYNLNYQALASKLKQYRGRVERCQLNLVTSAYNEKIIKKRSGSLLKSSYEYAYSVSVDNETVYVSKKVKKRKLKSQFRNFLIDLNLSDMKQGSWVLSQAEEPGYPTISNIYNFYSDFRNLLILGGEESIIETPIFQLKKYIDQGECSYNTSY